MECETGGINWTSLFKYPGLMLLLKALKNVFAVMVSKSCLLSTFQYFLSMFFCVDRQNQVLQAVLLCTPCSCNSLCLPTEPYKNPKQNMLSIYSPPLTLHRRVEVSGLVSFYKFCGRGERSLKFLSRSEKL